MGIIERVEDEECKIGRKHYLPFHAVVRQDKATTKVRVGTMRLLKSILEFH